MPSALVLPSPLLGPVAYRPLAAALTERGLDTDVAALPAQPFGPQDVLAAFVAQAGDVDVLVPHSNAGLYAPEVAAQCGPSATVHVDAALPAQGVRRTPLAPPGFLDRLRDLAGDDDVLPPWTRWWPEAEARGLFPDGWFDRVDAAAPRLPRAYFTATVPVPDGWERRPTAYLGFGGTYAEEQARASGYGWPLVVGEGHHLHLLTDPAAVARTVTGLAAALGVGAQPPSSPLT